MVNDKKLPLTPSFRSKRSHLMNPTFFPLQVMCVDNSNNCPSLKPACRALRNHRSGATTEVEVEPAVASLILALIRPEEEMLVRSGMNWPVW